MRAPLAACFWDREAMLVSMLFIIGLVYSYPTPQGTSSTTVLLILTLYIQFSQSQRLILQKKVIHPYWTFLHLASRIQYRILFAYRPANSGISCSQWLVDASFLPYKSFFFMYLLPLYTFFPPRRPERPIEEGRIQSVYSKRRNYRTFQATLQWRKCNWNNQERKNN